MSKFFVGYYNLMGFLVMQLGAHMLSQPIRSQCTLSVPPENIRKPLMFSEGTERVHWKRMGSDRCVDEQT